MRFLRLWLVGATVFGASVVLLAACSTAAEDRSGAWVGGLSMQTTTAVATPTTSPPNQPPELDVEPEFRAVVGEVTQLTIEATDDADDPVILLGSLPAGARYERTDGRITSIVWKPAAPGVWPATVQVRDSEGLTASADIQLIARYRPRPNSLIGLGDSVASGHGRDRDDYLGTDDCWRAEDEAYSALVFETLRQRAVLNLEGRHALVACSGADVEAMVTVDVTGGFPADDDASGGDQRHSQVEWAVRANAGYVTITVGANDVRFDRPWELMTDSGELNGPAMAPKLRNLGFQLRSIVERLLVETDSTIIFTTYYDPAATSPQGVDGCERECFKAFLDDALAGLNATITEVAELDPERVLIVDLRTLFDGHGAPNGLGPDALRSGEILGPVGDFVADLFGGTHPYCAKGDTLDDTWISEIDCVHPNHEGQEAIAEAVVEVVIPGG